MTIKILLADDSKDARQLLRELIELETKIEVIGEAEDGAEAVEKTIKLKPDVVLMDINMPVLDGIQATEKISIASPKTAVIMCSVQGENEYLRKSMAAGAREFIVKPVMPEQLLDAIEHIYSLESKRQSKTRSVIMEDHMVHRPKNVVLFSSKSGVGKTTLATNLAVSAVQKGKRVALVDLDLQFGDTALFLSLNHQRKNIYRLIEEHHDVDSEVLNNYLIEHSSGVKLLAAPLRPEEGEYVTAKHVAHLLPLLKESFDFIVVDAPAVMDDIFFASIEAADILGLVTTPNLPILKNNLSLLEVLRTLRVNMEKIRLLLNRSYSKTGVRANDVIEALQMDLFWELPNDYETIATSVNQGVPFVMKHPKHRLSKQMSLLATKLLDEQRQSYLPKRGFRLFGSR